MRDTLIISRFAFLTGLSAKALRHYDEIGLLKPALVDDQTGYRYYAISQIALASRIRKWKQMGLPLEDIRVLIEHPHLRQEVLRGHEKRLLEDIRQREQALWHVRHDMQEDPMEYRTEHLPRLQTLCIQTHLDPEHYEVIPQAFQELMGHVKQQGYTPSHPSFFVCHNQHQEGKSLLEMHVPVEGPITATGRIEVRTFEGGLAFIGRFVGPYHKTGAAYSVVVDEALRRGLSITGSTAEIYVKSVPHTPNPEGYETDIAFFLNA